MKYLNELEYSAPQSLYAGEPVQEIKALNKSMSDEYESTRQNKDLLDVWAANLDVRDVDYGAKKNTIDAIRSQFQDLVSRGDYQNARFVVNDAIKKYKNDPLIQGALKSKAAENQYKEDLRTRLEKGQINQDQFNYGMLNTKAKNQKALTYNPETGQYENFFGGYKVFDDKSKEIYDNFNSRIKDWQEGDVQTIGGQRFQKISSLPGGYYNMETKTGVSKEEVQNALMTELSNRGDFADFLKQEKNIDKFTLTGGSNVLTKDSLKSFIPEDEINNALAGTSTSELNTLKNSKNPKDIARYNDLIEKKKIAATQQPTSEQLEQIFNDRYSRNQINKYTEPAADKASFEKTKDDKWENKTYLMSLDYKYRRAEKELDEQKATIGISNQSVMENFSPEELHNNYNALKKADEDINFLKQKYKGNLNTNLMTPEDRNIYEKAKINKDLIQKNLDFIKEDMRSKGVDMNQIALKNIYLNNDKEVERVLIDPLINTVLKSGKISEADKKELIEFKNKPMKSSSDGEALFNILNKNKESRNLMTNFSNKVIELARNEKTPGTGGGSGGVTGFLENVKMGLEEGEQKYFESKDLIRTGGQVLAIDEKDKNNIVGNEARQWNNLAKLGTDFKMNDGTNISEFINKYNEENDLKDNKALKVEDVQVQPIYQKINGQYKFQLRLPNGQLKQVTPQNQQDAEASLRRIAQEYVKSTDPATANKGYEMLGQIHNDFSRINLNEFKSNEVIPVPLNNGGQENIYSLVKTGEDNSGNPTFSLKNADGTDITFNGVPLDNVIKGGLKNPNGNNFKSLNDLATTLYLTGFNGK